MQEYPRLTLESAITQVRQSEAVKQQQPLLRGKPVGAVNKSRGAITRGSKDNAGASPTTTNHTPHSRCNWCGRAPHDKSRCPARDKICNKRGHFKTVCKSQARINGVWVPLGDAFLGAVSDSSEGDPWTVKLKLQWKPVALYIDSGAEVTVITERVWRSVGRPQMEPSDRTLRGPDSSVIPTAGKFVGTFTLGDRTANTDVYVAKRLTKSLLGRSAILNLKLITRIAAVDHS